MYACVDVCIGLCMFVRNYLSLKTSNLLVAVVFLPRSVVSRSMTRACNREQQLFSVVVVAKISWLPCCLLKLS